METLATTKITVHIDNIIPNAFNPNEMSEFMYEKMKQTIKEKGLFGSIYVTPTAGMYRILDGEHRWKACKELGMTWLPVECAKEMTDQEVKFWTVYFNNTRGKDDIEKRAQIFKELDNGQTSLLPFTQEEIDNEKALFSFDFSQYDKPESERQGREVVRAIMIPVTEDEWAVWEKAKEVLKQENKTDVWFMMQAVDSFLQLYSLK